VLDIGAALLALIALSACGDSSGPGVPVVAAVNVTPGFDTILVGQIVPLTAVVLDSVGDTLRGRSISWSGADSATSVSTAGAVKGLAPGAATISATVGGHTGSASIVVHPVPVAYVTITPDTTATGIGPGVTLTAYARD
jgi:uncharacterized protein YjdB